MDNGNADNMAEMARWTLTEDGKAEYLKMTQEATIGRLASAHSDGKAEVERLEASATGAETGHLNIEAMRLEYCRWHLAVVGRELDSRLAGMGTE